MFDVNMVGGVKMQKDWVKYYFKFLDVEIYVKQVGAELSQAQ